MEMTKISREADAVSELLHDLITDVYQVSALCRALSVSDIFNAAGTTGLSALSSLSDHLENLADKAVARHDQHETEARKRMNGAHK